MVLQFLDPVFHDGTNLTVRKGIKWSLETGKVVDLVSEEYGKKAKIVDTKVIAFDLLEDADLELEHAPYCRTWEGLFETMCETYPGFDDREAVTLVFFEPLP